MSRAIYYGQPVNWSNPLMRGLISRWKVLPWYASGPRLLDIANYQYNHGTLTNGPTWDGALGRQGGSGSIDLDGSNDYVDLGTFLTIPANNQFGVCCWIYPRVLSGFQCIFGNTVFKLYCNGANLYCNGRTDTFTLTTNKWWQVGFYQSATLAQFFVNGNLQSSAAPQDFTSGNGTQVKIGQDPSSTSQSFNCLIDDLCWFTVSMAGKESGLFQQTGSTADPTLNWIDLDALTAPAAAPAAALPKYVFINQALQTTYY